MSILFLVRDSASYPTSIAILEVSLDADAERLIVMNRITTECLTVLNNTQSNTVKVRLPMDYIVSNNLLLLMVDDDAVFNVSAVDGVNCQIVSTPYDMSQ